MPDLTPADLDALQEYYAAATPGEWEGCFYRGIDMPDLQKVIADCCEGGTLEWWFAAQAGNQDKITAGTGNGPTSQRNLAHVVSMHNALPALLAMARECLELRAENERLNGEVKRLRYPFAKCGDCEWYTPTGCRKPIMWSTRACSRFQRATGKAGSNG